MKLLGMGNQTYPPVSSSMAYYGLLWFIIMVYYYEHTNMVDNGLPSGVIKQGWLENPRTEWRFLARKITYFYGPFSIAMLAITRGYIPFISH